MGWFLVNILVPIFSTIGVLWVIQRAPLPPEYKEKASVIRAVRDGQLGWVVIGIGSSLIYEVFSQDKPNYWFATFAILLVFGNALLSGFCIMFPYQDKPAQTFSKTWREKISEYPVLRDTTASLVAVSILYSVHHFLVLEVKTDVKAPVEAATAFNKEKYHDMPICGNLFTCLPLSVTSLQTFSTSSPC